MTNSKKIFNQLITLLRPVFTSSILILLSISVGTVGYMVLEHYTLVDAFFMTIITLATVGYGLVEPLSEVGKWFTSS